MMTTMKTTTHFDDDSDNENDDKESGQEQIRHKKYRNAAKKWRSRERNNDGATLEKPLGTDNIWPERQMREIE